MWLWIVGILAAVALRVYSKGRKNPYKADLSKKVILVTGGSAGIGKETAKELAKMGAKVYITGRDQQKALKVIEDINSEMKYSGGLVIPVEFLKLDLSDLEDIKRFIKEFKGKEEKLDILINNAGLMSTSLARTKQGLEQSIGSNFVGPVYLTHLCFPLLLKSEEARIINVSSEGYKFGMKLISKDKDGQEVPDDFLLEKLAVEDYSSFYAYTKSKLGNIFFTTKLATLLEKKGLSKIKTVAVHPGTVFTEMHRYFPNKWQIVITIITPLVKIFVKNENEGSQTTLTACCTPFEKLFSGGYYYECCPKQLDEVAKNKDREQNVWNLASAKISENMNERIFADLSN